MSNLIYYKLSRENISNIIEDMNNIGISFVRRIDVKCCILR